LPRVCPAGIRTRGIQSLAVAKVAFATDRQNGADCERQFQVSNQTITGSGRRTRLPQYATDVTGGVTMLPLSRRFKVGGHVQSGQLLRA